jgi:type IV secretion system T-DNA border endonuclease VirD2
MAFVREAVSGEPEPISEAEQQRLVEQVNERLSPDAITALRSGEPQVLDKFTEDPLRELELAMSYLQSSEVTAHGPAMERVLDALAEEQIEAQRSRHAASHGEKGVTHG